MRDFLLGIFSNWVADALGASAMVGVLLAWLKKRGSSWLIPLCWGLSGSVVVLIGASALKIVSTPTPTVLDVNPSNVEAYLNQWIDAFHFGRRKLPEDPVYFFKYEITNTSGRFLQVARLRSSPWDRYLTFTSSVSLAGEEATKISKLSEGNMAILVHDLRMEVARSKIGFSNLGTPLTTINLEHSVPITTDLSDASFVESINNIDLTLVLLLNFIPVDVDRLSSAN